MPDRPTICRSCGAIVGAGEPNCGVCDAPIAAPPTTQQRQRLPDRETLRFARAVLDRPYKFTITFLIANLFVYLLMWQSSGLANMGLLQEFPSAVLIAYGAKLNSLIAAPNREWWRFVTPMFIHVNLLHLLVNMYSLWMIGPYVEKLYGSAKFVVFWVLTGIAGVVASYLTVRPNLATGGLSRFLFKTLDEPSAGASGALFGLVGVLFVFGIKFRHELPEGFKRAFGTGLLPVILINLFIGFLGRRFIDNAAHLGGLLSGAALALVVQYRRPGESQTSAITWRVFQIAALGILAVSFLKVAEKFNSPPPQQAITNQVEVFNAYVSVMNRAQESLSAVLYESDTSNIDPAVQAVQSVPAPDPKADDLRKRLVDLMIRATTQAVSSPSPQQGPRRGPKLDERLIAEYVTWRKEYEVWLKTAVPSLHP
jgi:rhomboid protease GluP